MMTGGEFRVAWLEPLAEWVAAAEPAGCDDALANTALDWAGAAIAGTAHPLAARYVAALAACGNPAATGAGCAVMGDARAWPLAEAAAANAALSHLWEFDDSHRAASMHPGITVYPVVFALAQSTPGITAARMRAATVGGYEAGLRVGALLGKQHYLTCHTTGTAGAFGAAAAAARMLGLDAQATLWAFGHAGTQAAGLWQILDDGAAAAKAFHAAAAVRNGITAAMLARAGIPGAARILEGRRGMLAAWHLEAAEPALTPAPGDVPEIVRTTIKGWPVCGQMHSVLDAAETLATMVTPAALARVRVDAPSALLDIADVKRPATVAALKFSTSFCVALLLSGGRLPFVGLDEGVLADAAVQAMADRVEVVHDPALDPRYPAERPCRVTVWTHAGEQHVIERSFRRGDPEQPWQWPPLVERFRGIAGLARVDAAAQDAIVAWCAAFGRGDADPDAATAVLFQRPFR